jgi:hypothetical protein
MDMLTVIRKKIHCTGNRHPRNAFGKQSFSIIQRSVAFCGGYIVAHYQLRIAQVIRDDGMFDRKEAPADSKYFHKEE